MVRRRKRSRRIGGNTSKQQQQQQQQQQDSGPACLLAVAKKRRQRMNARSVGASTELVGQVSTRLLFGMKPWHKQEARTADGAGDWRRGRRRSGDEVRRYRAQVQAVSIGDQACRRTEREGVCVHPGLYGVPVVRGRRRGQHRAVGDGPGSVYGALLWTGSCGQVSSAQRRIDKGGERARASMDQRLADPTRRLGRLAGGVKGKRLARSQTTKVGEQDEMHEQSSGGWIGLAYPCMSSGGASGLNPDVAGTVGSRAVERVAGAEEPVTATVWPDGPQSSQEIAATQAAGLEQETWGAGERWLEEAGRSEARWWGVMVLWWSGDVGLAGM
ncbi:hypothetical protein MAPG_05405 [Magnaporthiopsis poae ATCC 64411]|uniref:Uncharacterized protein n=1 Tax=Magnaporthiopsis poae (strain ATCC 64411 / 73-15) TaxID=644358 RepID=A0A0C4DZB0_MAGP6|nr:hypothetical protein MAPG_05405 [Magnaporthiopsis poae ATCC 64411]